MGNSNTYVFFSTINSQLLHSVYTFSDMQTLDSMSTHFCVQDKFRPMPYIKERKQHFLSGDQVVFIINKNLCNVFDRIPCLAVLV